MRTQLLWLLCFCTVAPSAHALELLAGFGTPIYLEDFANEIAFPTIAEVDTHGFGGTQAFRSGNPLPLAPTISGGEVLIAVQEASPYGETLRSSGVQVPFAAPPDMRIGVAAHFDGYETVKDPTNGQFQTVAVTLLDSALGNGATGYLLEFGSGALRLAVSTLGPILSGYDDVSLTANAENAIRGGAPFLIEFAFDTVARTAQASLTVGDETFTTTATSSPVFDAMNAIDAVLVVNTTTNNEPPIATIASDLQDVAIYLSVPEPGATAAGVTSLLALALHRRRRTAPQTQAR